MVVGMVVGMAEDEARSATDGISQISLGIYTHTIIHPTAGISPFGAWREKNKPLVIPVTSPSPALRSADRGGTCSVNYQIRRPTRRFRVAHAVPLSGTTLTSGSSYPPHLLQMKETWPNGSLTTTYTAFEPEYASARDRTRDRPVFLGYKIPSRLAESESPYNTSSFSSLLRRSYSTRCLSVGARSRRRILR